MVARRASGGTARVRGQQLERIPPEAQRATTSATLTEESATRARQIRSVSRGVGRGDRDGLAR